MASPPFSFDITDPADNAVVSNFPANERTFRDNVNSMLAVEHDVASGHHAIPSGSSAARDAITTWVAGSLWLLTSTTPASLQRVVSIGPIVWETIAGPADTTTQVQPGTVFASSAI